ncbi:hypothetical protein ACFDR9_000833 [Janthinobacterium sp. CG_23.3]|uniref:hypothetical protein n=1 Tax=Janthinobacterium sp. CG_23.3 TaxID=3349634 RepID=UPI0038D4D5A5
MTTDTQDHPFAGLNSLGLMTDAQRGLALAHPRYDEVAFDDDLVRHLVWLVSVGILSERALAEKAAERLLARRQGEAFEERKAVLEQTMKTLLALRREANRQAIATLCAEGLISVAERSAATRRAPSERAFGSPAAALAWMVMSGLLERAQFDQLRARVRAERSGAARARSKIVEQARVTLRQARRALLAAFWRQVLPGSPWLWLGGVALVLGGPLWYLLMPVAVPACDAALTVNTVRNMLFLAHVSARQDARLVEAPAGAPSLGEVREVGYASGPRLRGCAAKLDDHGIRTPYAYTIGPAADDSAQFDITGAEPALVAARFGRIDPDGGFGNKAEPVGRDQLERAFRAGVDTLRHDATSARHALMLEQMRRASAVSRSARERLREIAELEPLGACRVLKPGTQYACRLMFERNDPLLAAIGVGSSTVLQADFTFERSAGGQTWRVAPTFAEEFSRAVGGQRGEPLKMGMSQSAALPPQQ